MLSPILGLGVFLDIVSLLMNAHFQPFLYRDETPI